MLYSDVFKNLDKRAIEATALLPAEGFWKKDLPIDEKISICEKWLKTLSEIYKVNVPDFRFSESESNYLRTGGGVYESRLVRITLYKKISLVTLLHEFRHHLQHQKNIKLYKKDLEEDARAWSLSLYKQALPDSYQNSVDKRNLRFY